MRSSALRAIALLILPGMASAGEFTPLGSSGFGIANGVSAHGEVVVGVGNQFAVLPNVLIGQPFRWTQDGGAQMLSPGDFVGSANGVSADGEVVVGINDTANEAFRWREGVMTGLGQYTEAYGVSGDGAVVVGLAVVFNVDSVSTEAFRWTDDVFTGLGFLPGGVGSAAKGASADGAVVVGESTNGVGSEAFRWTGGVMTGLGFLPGAGSYSTANGVSANGAVVVGEASNGVGTEAFRWTGGVMTGLGFLPGGDISVAKGVSADGAVVVGQSNSLVGGFASNEAFVWTQANGMERLEDVLAATGATGLTGWKLVSASAVSADGQWVVGAGTNPAGDEEAFLANISPPDSGGGGSLDGLSLLALGLMGAMRRKVTSTGSVHGLGRVAEREPPVVPCRVMDNLCRTWVSSSLSPHQQ